jgi:hypothetical protein
VNISKTHKKCPLVPKVSHPSISWLFSLGSHCCVIFTISLPFLEFCVNEIMQMYSFSFSVFHLVQWWGSAFLWSISVVHPFLLLCYIPLYRNTIIYLLTIWSTFALFPFWGIKNKGALYENMLLFLLGKYPVVKWLDHFNFFFFFVVLGFELRDSSHSTSPFLMMSFFKCLVNYLPGLASNRESPDLCLLRS